MFENIICKEDFETQGNSIVPGSCSGCYGSLFYSHYSGKINGKNCTDLKTSNERVSMHRVIYLCKICRENRVIKPTILQYIEYVYRKMI